ncbi:hypothetical protein FOZ63_009979 [Perkinsus olseni]|uniref:Uncharacterized protein n=1 Tax=Perkinsus olseni TaxID=32597 RepID=A0A7J6U7J5_PEROL|nr:hypothetical protein FOZ63_009979 [Perkinsus olseni]
MFISHWWRFKMHYSHGIPYTRSERAEGPFVRVEVNSENFTSFAWVFDLDPEKWKLLPSMILSLLLIRMKATKSCNVYIADPILLRQEATLKLS